MAERKLEMLVHNKYCKLSWRQRFEVDKLCKQVAKATGLNVMCAQLEQAVFLELEGFTWDLRFEK